MTQPQTEPARNLHRLGFTDLEEETYYWVSDIEGKLPDIKGTLFRNGPGRNTIGGKAYGHWFDGDGMLSAVTFNGEEVHFKNKYVRTRKYIEESEHDAVRFRGFGTQRPGGFLANMFRLPENAANTSVVYHGGKLLALWEGGKPYEIDPTSLNTSGEYDYNGALKGYAPYSAHGKVDAKTGNYVNFGIEYGLINSLHLYNSRPDGKMTDHFRFNLPYGMLCHDFALSENHALFFLSPLVVGDLFGFLMGTKSLDEALEWQPKRGMLVYLINWKTGKLIQKYKMDSFFVFHIGNSYEEDGQFKTIIERMPDFAVGENLRDIFGSEFKAAADLWQFEFDLSSDFVSHRPLDIDDNLDSEFPMWNFELNGQKNQYMYAATVFDDGNTPGYFNSIQKIDLATGHTQLYQFEPGFFTTEAVYVPGKGETEDDGYLISFVLNCHTKKTEVTVLKASDMTLVCKIKLNHLIPFGFHGFFVPQVFL